MIHRQKPIWVFGRHTWPLPIVALVLIVGAGVKLTADGGEPDPAPATDRVEFPASYATQFTVLRRTTNADTATQVTVYGNAAAASVTQLSALPYPNGSVFVMETMRLKRDAAGKALKDAEGKYSEDIVLGLHVMRRGAGFGAAYGPKRSGEWEYVEYHPDGTFITPPQKSAACAACHQKAGPERDYVMKARFADQIK